KRLSVFIRSPLSLPFIRQLTPSGMLFLSKTVFMIFWHAIPHNGVFSLGFQTQTSPQTHASIAFQLHTATGKLNADIIPTTPTGWYCSYMRCIGLSLCIVSP